MQRWIWGFFFCAWACAEPAVQVNKLDQGRRGPFPAVQSVRWGWQTNEEGVRILAWQLTLRTGELAKYKRAQPESGSTTASLRGDTLTVQFRTLVDKVVLSGAASGPDTTLEIVGRPHEVYIIEEGCKKTSLLFRPQTPVLPFYVGASCTTKDGATGFALSFPEEVEFNTSSLFETKGKGEPWRFYDLGKINLFNGILGTFTLKYKNTPYKFTLEYIEKRKAEQADAVKLIAGAGYVSLGVNGSDVAAQDAKPLLRLRVPHFPLTGILGVSFDLDIGMPLVTNANSITYSQFTVFGSLEFPIGTQFRFFPKIGYTVAQQAHDSTGISLGLNQVSFGGTLEGIFGTAYHVFASGMWCGLGIDSHYLFDLSALRKMKDTFGWGGGLSFQSFKATGSLLIQRDFSLFSIYGLIAF